MKEKNRLVNIEGIDGVGKSTVIKALKEKYPSIHVIAFPTQRLRDTSKEHEHKFETFGDLFAYHYQFLEDFASEQERLYNLVQSNTLVLIDRYYLSNYVYLLADVIKHLNSIGSLYKDSFNEISIELTPSLIEFYKELEDPSLIIYLEKPKVNGGRFESIVNLFYSLTLEKMDDNDYVKIKGLQEDTISNIEKILKDRGYLDEYC